LLETAYSWWAGIDGVICHLSAENHIGCFFGNHDGWCIGVARCRREKNKSVNNAKIVYAIDAAVRIDNRITVIL
jgi:hypothetical protein